MFETNIFDECEKIFIPINTRNSHWTLAVIFVKSLTIKYYDSLMDFNTAPNEDGNEDGNARFKLYLDALKRWICDEVQEKSSSYPYDVESWNLEYVEDYPQQIKADCGIFTIMCADFLSDDLELSFGAEDMPYFREKILKDIQKTNLDYYMQPEPNNNVRL
jgi:sentrin-specific protease 1